MKHINFNLTSHSKYWMILIFLFYTAALSAQVKLMVTGSIELDDGEKPSGVVVTVEKNGAQFKKISISETGKFAVSITYQDEFILSFEKKGYVTKKIAISTIVPKSILDEGYDPITFKVGMFKQYEGMNTVIFNQPVSRYKYDEKTDDFIYDTDYTKTIQSEITKVEAEVQVKQQVEKEQKKTLLAANAKNNNNSTNQVNNKDNSKNNINPATGNDKDNRQKANALSDSEIDMNKKAKAKSDDEWKKKLAAKNNNYNNVSSEEDKAKRAKAKEEDFARMLREAKAKGEEEMRKLLADARMKSYLSKIYPEGITIETTKDKWKETKRVIVNRNGMCNIFSEVIHSWGGKYYFKNNETISQYVFTKETKPLGNEAIYNKTE